MGDSLSYLDNLLADLNSNSSRPKLSKVGLLTQVSSSICKLKLCLVGTKSYRNVSDFQTKCRSNAAFRD